MDNFQFHSIPCPFASRHRDSTHRDSKWYLLNYRRGQNIIAGTTQSQCCVWHRQSQHTSRKSVKLGQAFWDGPQLVQVIVGSGRGYYLSIGGHKSKWTSGVPEGTVIAPFLFNFFMLPLSQIIRNQTAYHSYY